MYLLSTYFFNHNLYYFQAVGKKDKCVFKSYVELSSFNWKGLKELLEDMNVPAIPHLGKSIYSTLILAQC